jgi:hypothetical protein
VRARQGGAEGGRGGVAAGVEAGSGVRGRIRDAALVRPGDVLFEAFEQDLGELGALAGRIDPDARVRLGRRALRRAYEAERPCMKGRIRPISASASALSSLGLSDRYALCPT